MPEHQIGQLRVRDCGDLVAVIHREPVCDERSHTFRAFEDREYWTQMTPANARRLAEALTSLADYLERAAMTWEKQRHERLPVSRSV